VVHSPFERSMIFHSSLDIVFYLSLAEKLEILHEAFPIFSYENCICQLPFDARYCRDLSKIGLQGCQRGAYNSSRLISFPQRPMSYVVASKLKELVKKHGMMSSGDLADALSKHLEGAVATACNRAKANGRKTVRPEDL